MTGEWEEKKGQKQTDRWSGKVMQLKGWNSTQSVCQSISQLVDQSDFPSSLPVGHASKNDS